MPPKYTLMSSASTTAVAAEPMRAPSALPEQKRDDDTEIHAAALPVQVAPDPAGEHDLEEVGSDGDRRGRRSRRSSPAS